MSQTSDMTSAAAIGAKTKFKGDLVAEEDLLIEGSLAGSAVLTGNKLTIGNSGQLNGQALAKVVCVVGSVEGDLYASELIEVRKGAKIKGNLVSARISFEDGALLRGSVEMDPEEVQKAIREKFGSGAGAPTAKPAAATPEAPKPQPAPSLGGQPAPSLGGQPKPAAPRPATPTAQAS